MNLMILGDTHGDAPWIGRACQKAVNEDCDTIVQLGDFGYWSHTVEGEYFLDQVEALLVSHGLTMYWLDGNHENHTLLRSRIQDGTYPHADIYDADDDGCYDIRQGLYYLPRGVRWTWDGVRFMALGGADSIDKQFRHPGASWWPEEVITDEEVEHARRGVVSWDATQGEPWVRNSIVDVLFTHDAPYARHQDQESNWYDRKYPLSKLNKQRVRKVMDAVHPKLLVHGHQHRNYELWIGDTKVKGLGMNGDPGSMWVMDTEEWK